MGTAPQDWGKLSLGGDTLFPQDGDLSEFGDPFRLGTPLPAWKIPPKWGFPRMGTPHPAWGHPPVREHPQDGDTPSSMGLPLKMEIPLERGHLSLHGDHPSKMDGDTIFLTCSPSLALGWQVLPGWDQVGWLGRA